MSPRFVRRFGVPLVVVCLAAALGTFVLGRTRVSASSPALENSGISLTASMEVTNAAQIAAGRVLYMETCSSCHGGDAQGSSLAPNIQNVGGGAVDLWISAGWMPLRTAETQPEAKPVYLTRPDILAIVAYVTSKGNGGGYPVPPAPPLDGNRAAGFDMFSLNCAPCHTITGSGDALASGVRAPSLRNPSITGRMVLEAIRTGPENMPVFAPGSISRQQALDIVAFVKKDIQHPANIGGIGLGGVGPVAEGFVGLFVGVGVCLLAAYWVGDRTDPDAYSSEGDGHDGDDGDGSRDNGDPEAGATDGAVAEAADAEETLS